MLPAPCSLRVAGSLSVVALAGRVHTVFESFTSGREDWSQPITPQLPEGD